MGTIFAFTMCAAQSIACAWCHDNGMPILAAINQLGGIVWGIMAGCAGAEQWFNSRRAARASKRVQRKENQNAR
jgi:hypothetical protein